MNFQELRRSMIVLQNTLIKLRPSRELSLCNTSLQKTMMWCGTYLKHENPINNPYAKHDGFRKTEKHIEPLFDDTSDTLAPEILSQGLIYTVDQIREYLQKQTDALVRNVIIQPQQEDSVTFSPEKIVNTNLTLANIYTNLVEARMWLGMELGRIKREGEDAPEVRL